MAKRDSRQGAYLIITPTGRLYIGSVAGAHRSFDQRRREHERAIERGAHPNDGLRQGGVKGLRFIPLAVVSNGDVPGARRIEQVLIKAIRGLCNERGMRQ